MQWFVLFCCILIINPTFSLAPHQISSLWRPFAMVDYNPFVFVSHKIFLWGCFEPPRGCRLLRLGQPQCYITAALLSLQGFIQPPPGMVNSTPGKISHPVEFVWLSPPGGGRELLSSHVSHKLLPTDEFLSRKTRFRPGPAGGAYSTPSDPLAGLRGILQRGWGGEPSGSFSRFLALYKFVYMFLTLTRPSPLKKIPGKSPVSSARAV